MSEQNINTAPKENWEEELEAETSLPQKISKMGLNANAPVFKPNVNAKEFVPSWLKNDTQQTSAPAPAATPAETPAPKPQNDDADQTSAPAPVPSKSLPLSDDADHTQTTSAPVPAPVEAPTPKPLNDKITTTSIADDQAQDDAVDEEVIEDLYGKEHVNLVFIGHVDLEIWKKPQLV